MCTLYLYKAYHFAYCRYRSAKDSSFVDYVSFSDDVESVFTIKELEKMPTLEVQEEKIISN